MERIGAVQARVDRIVAGQTDATDIKFGYVHLYSVSQACALLAMKRQENVELAAIARVCERSGVKCLSIKCISDAFDGTGADFEKNVKRSAEKAFAAIRLVLKALA